MMTKEFFESSLKEALAFWGTKSREEVMQLLGADVGAMVGYEQKNPHHCFDLFQHVLHTVEELPDSASGSLRVAAFFHDIGKTHVAQEKENRMVFYGHAKKSGELVRVFLRKMGYSSREIAEICFYIEHHDDFIPWVFPEEYKSYNKYEIKINRKNFQNYIKRQTEELRKEGFVPDMVMWRQLFELCQADVAAQAETVIQDGKIIDTREHKKAKLKQLQKYL